MNLQLSDGDYLITIADAPACSAGSADNLRKYDYVHTLDSSHCDRPSSCHSVLVSKKDAEVASCILLADGGVTGVHQHSALIHNKSCIIAVGPYVARLRIPSLELQWATQADCATCFGIYHAMEHEGFISHGELTITRLSYEGDIVWQSGGADIFTNGFDLHGDRVQAVDFYNRRYEFDIRTGEETAPS